VSFDAERTTRGDRFTEPDLPAALTGNADTPARLIDSYRRTHTACAPTVPATRVLGRGLMIILILRILGIILTVIRGVLRLLGSMDRKVGPRRHHY